MKIEKGIPMPEATQTSEAKWWFLRTMEVGESVLITEEFLEYPIRWRAFARRVLETVRGTFQSKTVDGGVRVWRIN